MWRGLQVQATQMTLLDMRKPDQEVHSVHLHLSRCTKADLRVRVEAACRGAGRGREQEGPRDF